MPPPAGGDLGRSTVRTPKTPTDQHGEVRVHREGEGRFAQANGASAHAGHSVEAGRADVAAYVELVHYAERLRRDVTANAAAGEHKPAAGHAH